MTLEIAVKEWRDATKAFDAIDRDNIEEAWVAGTYERLSKAENRLMQLAEELGA